MKKRTRTALIMGASSDIGLSVCRWYAEENWRVIGLYRTPRAELEELSKDRVGLLRCDFSDAAEFEALLDQKRSDLCCADAMVNLAADLSPRPFEDADAESIFSTLRVNLLPGIRMTQVVGPAMVERGFGRIVHASSIGVKFGGGVDTYCYSLSKHAVEFIPSAVRKWARHGVFTNVVRVGVTATRLLNRLPDRNMETRTALIPAGRLASPDGIAEYLCWLGSEKNSYIAGQVVAASGGE